MLFLSFFFFCFRFLFCRGISPAERGGFEPPIRFWRIHAFQACLFNHSSISPSTFSGRQTSLFSSLFEFTEFFSYKCILFIRLTHLSFQFNFTKRLKLIYFNFFKPFFDLFHPFSNTFLALFVVIVATSSILRPYTEER